MLSFSYWESTDFFNYFTRFAARITVKGIKIETLLRDVNRNQEELDDWITEKVLPHEKDLRNWIQSRFPTIRDVDDLVQESYWRLSKAFTSGPIANPRAYLFATTRNLALRRIKEFQQENPLGVMKLDPSLIPDYARIPSESIIIEDELSVLKKAIQSLPTRCRRIIVLKKIYGLSSRNIAVRMGISVHTVEAQTRIGLAKCVCYFRQNGYVKTNSKNIK